MPLPLCVGVVPVQVVVVPTALLTGTAACTHAALRLLLQAACLHADGSAIIFDGSEGNNSCCPFLLLCQPF